MNPSSLIRKRWGKEEEKGSHEKRKGKKGPYLTKSLFTYPCTEARLIIKNIQKKKKRGREGKKRRGERV